MEKVKCPEVRFKGFSNRWKQQTLGDMFIPLSNNTLSRADLNYDNGRIKNIHYGDILVKYAAVLDYKNDKIPVITDGEISDFKSQLLQNGDVIFADTAEDEAVGKAIEINVPADTSIVSGLHTMAYRPKVKLSSFYLGHYLNSNAYHHQLLPLMQGVKVLSISRTNLAKTIVRYPLSEQEQTQIGHFFQNLDQSIALHEKKLAQTQNLKKAMLEKMFPKAGSKQPEIRLKGFSGDWEKKLLEDEVEFFSGLTYSPDDVTNKNGTLVLRSSNVQNNQICIDDNVYVVHDAVNVCNVEVGDIIVVVRNGSRDLIGKHAVINEQMKNTVIGAFMTGVKARNPYFINALFNTNLFDLAVSRNLGATINQITTGMFKQMEFKFPDKTEQIAIGKFFKQLDETLTLQQQQLQTLKNLKKAFLEKMFV
ncbi:restriction endonuclease subunit S [Acinetobacter sp. ESL0695]|uniref:restriction endonuclease subunit S n=1 Tax=Acinetobacter sp. ESL0695 TaxID=2983215 RepID=UPI0023F3E4E3|nr:restriction endonuclease subunit S [Acinetobacter sp. ESL0695]WEV48377.1 restriction endonuclease subunit S [Acinetobacter sp. ESL0695]